jgi:pantothenate kinase
MVGIAGGPGAGKSTLAAAIVRNINLVAAGKRALYVPMDGFHKKAAVLESEDLSAVKGKPETFEANAFLSFLTRIKKFEKGIRGPVYSREIEDIIENAYEATDEDIAIVEGNYLFLGDMPWRAVRELLDYKIFLRVEKETALARLYERQLHGGKPQYEAELHVPTLILKIFGWWHQPFEALTRSLTALTAESVSSNSGSIHQPSPI